MIKEIELSARMLKLLLVGAVLIALALFFRLWLHERDQNQTLVATVQSTERQAVAANNITQDITDSVERADKEVQRLTQLRRDWQLRYQKVLNEDKQSADWATQPVPSELRQLACERRLARDSIAGAEAGSGTADTGSDACVRDPTS